MPVNPLPVLVALILVWTAIAYFLFRWLRWAGRSFVSLSAVAVIVHIISTGVERQFDEQMAFRLVEIGDYRTLELTTSRRDRVTAGSSELVSRLRFRTNQTVRVLMTGWYDYGHLQAYRVQSIDGVSP
jgi:hypothetical protein